VSVRDYPRINARHLADQLLGQGLLEAPHPAAGAWLTHQDVPGAAVRYARDDVGDVVALLDDQLGAEDRGEPAQRLQLLAILSPAAAVRAGPRRTGRGPPRAAATSASTRSVTGSSASPKNARGHRDARNQRALSDGTHGF
jgi:hypothetical protein